MSSVRNNTKRPNRSRSKKNKSERTENQDEVLVIDVIRGRVDSETCSVCKKKLSYLIRIGGSEECNEKVEFPFNTARICTNSSCSMFLDLNKVKNWKLKKSI